MSRVPPVGAPPSLMVLRFLAGYNVMQTQSATVLKKVLSSPATRDMLEEDRQQLLSFLSGGGPFSQGYAPQSGQIVGLLKQLGDDMATSLAQSMAAEEKA